MQVPMNPAETLLNFIVHHTDLYMRTKKGETPAEHDQRWRTAFQKLSPWLSSFREKVRKEAWEELAEFVASEPGLTWPAEIDSFLGAVCGGPFNAACGRCRKIFCSKHTESQCLALEVDLRGARVSFVEAALGAKDEKGRRLVLKETVQLLVDLVDALQQSDEETPIIAVHRAMSEAMGTQFPETSKT